MNGCSGIQAPASTTPMSTPSPFFTHTPTIAVPTDTKSPRSTAQIIEDDGLEIIKPFPRPTLIPSATILPTITPTFDSSLIVTRTASPAAICPDFDENYLFDNKIIQDAIKNEESVLDDFLNFLNNGGNPSSLIDQDENDIGILRSTHTYMGDLTGDSIPDLVATNYNHETYVFGCRDGEYELLLTEKSLDYIPLSIAAVEDLNLNGVNEIILYSSYCMWGDCLETTIYEWDGVGFQNLILWYFEDTILTGAWMDGMSNRGKPEIIVKDTDGNGTLELVLVGGIPANPDLRYMAGPWRETTVIYMWNGKNFARHRVLYDSPQYRFQAVQDGDRAALAGDYDQAFTFYRQAIEDEGLEWWSIERLEYDIAIYRSSYQPQQTPLPPVPTPDPEEYPILAAYAYYRIILLDVLLMKLPEAEAIYGTLSVKFPINQPGDFFTILASTFLEEYKATQQIYLSCQKVIQYMEHYPEILAYLGEHNHGMESIVYTPADICPFY